MKQERVGNVPGNVLGMVADLAHKLQHGTIAPEELGRFLKRQNPFDVAAAGRYANLISDYQNFYNELGIPSDFLSAQAGSNLRIPKHQKGIDRLIIVPKGLTIQGMYDKCNELFHCYKTISGNLDEAVPTNDRDPKNGSYAIWVRDRVEADEELRNLSANDLKAKNIQGTTLLERFILGAKYFKETGKHLDIENITLCSGSRRSYGSVPYVRWYCGCGEVRVGWFGPDDACARLRSRLVVS